MPKTYHDKLLKLDPDMHYRIQKHRGPLSAHAYIMEVLRKHVPPLGEVAVNPVMPVERVDDLPVVPKATTPEPAGEETPEWRKREGLMEWLIRKGQTHALGVDYSNELGAYKIAKAAHEGAGKQPMGGDVSTGLEW